MDSFLQPRDQKAAEAESRRREEQLNKARAALTRMWPSYSDFRQKQADAIADVLDGKDTLCIMPTGGGKTMIFAVPAMLGNGVTIVVSPLLALAADQVSNLLTAPGGGIPCAYLNSSVAEKTKRDIMADLERGYDTGSPYLKLLFVTPEALVNSGALQTRIAGLAANNFIDRFVVDEAHCFAEKDHEILTNKGFMDLDELQALWGDPRGPPEDKTLFIAGYCTNSRSIVYERPLRLVVNDAREDQPMIEFTHANYTKHWDAKNLLGKSDGDGSIANHTSLIVTSGHDMYVRKCTLSATGQIVKTWGDHRKVPFEKLKARELLADSAPVAVKFLGVAEGGFGDRRVQDHDADELKPIPTKRGGPSWTGHGNRSCSHGCGYKVDRESVMFNHEHVCKLNDNVVRMFWAKAENMRYKTTARETEIDAYCKNVKEPIPDFQFVHQFALDSEEKVAAWLGLYGYWVGDGTLKFNKDDTDLCVSFHNIVKEHDVAWLRVQFSILGLDWRHHKGTKKRKLSNGNVETFTIHSVRITDSRYMAFYFDEYRLKYTAARRVRDLCPKSDTNSALKAAAFAEECRIIAMNGNCGDVDGRSDTGPTMPVDPTMADADPTMADADPTTADPTMDNDSMMNPENIDSAKWIVSWMFRMSKKWVRIFLDGLRRADGLQRVDNPGNIIYTSSARMRDELVRLMLHAGYSPHFVVTHDVGEVVTSLRVTLTCKHVSWRILYTDNKQYAEPSLRKDSDMKEVTFSGRTWCVTTPSSFVIARRATKVKGFVTRASRPIILGNCISEWGHDFRPDYTQLGYVRDTWPTVPILALTATASPKTVDHIKSTLQINHPETCTHYGGIDRQNLHFEVRDKGTGNAQSTMYNVLHFITQEDNGKHRDETGIVYSLSRNDCEDMAQYLKEAGIKAEYYHALRAESDKRTVQTGWQEGKIKVVCATIAYGMGIDKLNCRYVLHTTMSKSLEGYYQEAGRAGRDGLPAQCVIYWSPRDEGRLLKLIRSNEHKRKVVLREEEAKLAYMTAYCADHVENCEASGDCRRQFFSDRFGHEKTGTRVKPCKTRCDNCLEYRRQQVPIPSGKNNNEPNFHAVKFGGAKYVDPERMAGKEKKRKVGAYDDEQHHEAEFDMSSSSKGGRGPLHATFRTGKDLLQASKQGNDGSSSSSSSSNSGGGGCFKKASTMIKANTLLRPKSHGTETKPGVRDKTAPSDEVVDLT